MSRYKVIIREKITLAIMDTSETFSGEVAWEQANDYKEVMWDKLSHKDKVDCYIEVVEII